jgi:demethylspheroidene O-methyltransferase
LLAPGPRTTDTIATAARLPVDSAERLLEAAEALGLFCRDRQGRWWLDDFGAVVAGNPGIRAMVRHHSMLYRDLADPVALLREPDRPTETNRFWAYAGSGSVDDETAAAYSELMAASQDLIAAEALGSYDFSRHRTVLDIGGGTGAFLKAVGAAHPGVALWLFDLPNVAELAADGFARDGWADRTRCAGGDFFSDPMPEGADCLTLVRVLCDHDDGPALRLLKNIGSGMRPSDTLLIAEPMAGRDADGAALAAYFGMYFLAMRSGHCRTPAAITALLGEAGFGTVERRRTRMPLFASVIVARN